MSLRKKYDARCSRCLMRLELCLCEEIPHLSLATRVVIVTNRREYATPTNTARLAAMALKNSAVLLYGELSGACDVAAHLQLNSTSLLLFPSDEAVALSTDMLASLKGPFNLVVPDGNWRRASKMCRRDPFLQQLPHVTLADPRSSGYLVRREIKPGGLATIEAIARALGVMEGEPAQLALEAIFQTMVTRTLRSRGTCLGPRSTTEI